MIFPLKLPTLLFFSLCIHAQAQVELSTSQEFPQYWNVNGSPTLLLGGTVDDNLFQIAIFGLFLMMKLLESMTWTDGIMSIGSDLSLF
jgi:hypothetical protein